MLHQQWNREMISLDAQSAGFHLTFEDDDIITSPRAVACEILPFAWRPPEFGGLSPELASHSSEHRDLTRLGGRRLVIVGGGQSALESAALLHETGSKVEEIVRGPAVRWVHRRRKPPCA